MKYKNIALALFVLIVFPGVSYLLFNYYGNKAIVLPPKYFYDTVIIFTSKGKQRQDTIWHSIKNFSAINQLQDTISWVNMAGKVVVVNFIFTRCPSFCPSLTRNMRRLQDAFYKKKDAVQFLSFTVDPAFDQPEILKQYADQYHVNHYSWWFLNLPEKELYQKAFEEFHVATETNGNADFVHTDKFILLDKKRRIRGYYSGQDSTEMKRLADNIVFLNLEKQ